MSACKPSGLPAECLTPAQNAGINPDMARSTSASFIPNRSRVSTSRATGSKGMGNGGLVMN
ncbi:hypothetical protein D1F64_04120 [Breoghania sp. L-A4]|nr:hypothetical protein D1F64_04120 [Breoghania sp. L-A4]